MINFEWDKIKATINYQKHGVEFDEAKSIFYDLNARIFDDVKHSIDEKRELVIGLSNLQRMLIVNFTERNNKIRIISSRLANKKERKRHEENR